MVTESGVIAPSVLGLSVVISSILIVIDSLAWNCASTSGSYLEWGFGYLHFHRLKQPELSKSGILDCEDAWTALDRGSYQC